MNQVNFNPISVFDASEKTLEELKKVVLFPVVSVSSMISMKKPYDFLELRELKSKVLVFIQRKERAYISEIVNQFNIDPKKAIYVLRELEREGKISET